MIAYGASPWRRLRRGRGVSDYSKELELAEKYTGENRQAFEVAGVTNTILISDALIACHEELEEKKQDWLNRAEAYLELETQLTEAREVIQLHASNGSPSAKDWLVKWGEK